MLYEILRGPFLKTVRDPQIHADDMLSRANDDAWRP